MRHLAAAVVLACVLSGTAWAGEIPVGDWAPPPPPPPPPATSSLVAYGEIPSGGRTGEIPSTGAPAPQASSMLLDIFLTLFNIGR